MRRYNGQSNGEAQAVSTCFRVAGLIRTVKAVKQMLQCLPGNVLNRIVYAELYAVALFRQSQMDLTVRSTVFNGIVQQDGNQLPDGILIPSDGNHRCNGNVKQLFLGFVQRLESICRFRSHIGKGKLDHSSLRLAFVHASQKNQCTG